MKISSEKSVAVYEWRRLADLPQDKLAALMDRYRKLGIDTIYLQVNDYLDVAELADVTARDTAIAQVTRTLEIYLHDATAQHIAVHALIGNPKWTHPDYQYLNELALEFVAKYNASHAPSESFVGLQYDNEPWNAADYQEDVQTNLEQYVMAAERILEHRSAISADTLQIGFAVPFWFDGDSSNTMAIVRNGKQAKPGVHLIDMINAYRNGYLVIMDYRNFARGADGAIENVSTDLSYILNTGSQCGATIALETTDVTPTKQTFFEKTYLELVQTVTEVEGSYRANPMLHGFAINDSEGLERLAQR